MSHAQRPAFKKTLLAAMVASASAMAFADEQTVQSVESVSVAEPTPAQVEVQAAVPVVSETATATAMASPAPADKNTRRLDKVVVTASGYELAVKDAPASISVITAEELQKKSYTDVTDALKHVSGVQIVGGGVEQSISIRGMNSEYTLFLIDGRPAQANDTFGLNGSQNGTPINFLPPIETIDRIEVIRGPASALYGSDAMGGVVNIITKKVVNTFSGSVTSEFTKADQSNVVNEDGFQTSAVMNLPLVQDKLSLQVNAAVQTQDESRMVGGSDSAATDPEYDRRSVGGKLAWKVNEGNTLTLGVSHATQERNATPGKSLALVDANGDALDPTYSKSIKRNYFLNHDGKFGNLQTFSYINFDSSHNPTRVNATTGNDIEFDVLTANSQATYFAGNHALTAGLTHKLETLTDGASSGLQPPVIPVANMVVEMERYQNSVFVEDSWTVVPDLTLTLSGRFDDNEAFGSHFSPKAYAVYHVTPNLTVKGGLTSGYKAPNLRQAATDFGSTSMGGVMIGNPDLKPETSVNHEIGFAYQFDSLDMDTSLTFYKTDYEDKINRTGRICPAAADNPNQEPCLYNGIVYPYHRFGYTAYENVDKSVLTGIEWTLEYGILENLTYRHTYTFTDTEQKTGEHKGKPLNNTAKHSFNANIDWQTTDKLNLWSQLNYRGKTSGRWQTGTSGSATNGVRYPEYRFVDVGMVYKPKSDLSLKAGIYNVANEKVTTDDNFAYNLDGRRFIVGFTKQF